MRKKVTLKDLINKNKSEISNDKKALEKIEVKIDKKHSA
ncbi:FbpB family small basic protein [Scopulibacillus cellulosilyticus]|uniref:FbpB family small basic protein n=1 Tax=Scopulibacillus cellulosilyticus TaxID=2665665 RepID=A0ABW2PQF0_9BACL